METEIANIEAEIEVINMNETYTEDYSTIESSSGNNDDDIIGI